jgi:hypothetical protein
VLRRTFEPKKEEVPGSCRRQHNEELHNLYDLPDTVRVMKPRRMKLVGMYKAWEKREMHIKFQSENLKGRDHAEDLSLDGRIILERILGK